MSGDGYWVWKRKKACFTVYALYSVRSLSAMGEPKCVHERHHRQDAPERINKTINNQIYYEAATYINSMLICSPICTVTLLAFLSHFRGEGTVQNVCTAFPGPHSEGGTKSGSRLSLPWR